MPCSECKNAMTKCNHCGNVFGQAHKTILAEKESLIESLEQKLTEAQAVSEAVKIDIAKYIFEKCAEIAFINRKSLGDCVSRRIEDEASAWLKKQPKTSPCEGFIEKYKRQLTEAQERDKAFFIAAEFQEVDKLFTGNKADFIALGKRTAQLTKSLLERAEKAEQENKRLLAALEKISLRGGLCPYQIAEQALKEK